MGKGMQGMEGEERVGGMEGEERVGERWSEGERRDHCQSRLWSKQTLCWLHDF